jgi:hypothetical protein
MRASLINFANSGSSVVSSVSRILWGLNLEGSEVLAVFLFPKEVGTYGLPLLEQAIQTFKTVLSIITDLFPSVTDRPHSSQNDSDIKNIWTNVNLAFS